MTTRRNLVIALCTTAGLVALAWMWFVQPVSVPPSETALAGRSASAEGSQTLASAEQIVGSLRRPHESVGRLLQGDVTSLNASQRLSRLDEAFETVRRMAEEIGNDSLDPNAIVKATDRSPSRLLEWVRTETLLVPYVGVLRGSAGVLVDRRGNSLDRALLLADLLRRSGHEARLARTTLSRSEAEKLLSSVRSGILPMRDETPSEMNQRAVTLLEELAVKRGASVESFRTAVAEVRRASEATRAELMRRVNVQTELIERIAGPALSRANHEDDEFALAGLLEHWWVQSNQSGTWVDLDPDDVAASLPSASVVTMPIGEVESGKRHFVRLIVGIECACGGRLEERRLIDYRVPAADLVGRSLLLRQVPAAAAPSGLAHGDVNDAALTRWLTGSGQWLSILATDTQQLAVTRFTATGLVSLDGTDPEVQGTGGGLMDAFGGGAEEPAASTAGHLTAEFIEYQIESPGQPSTVERRYLFDWIGPSARASLAALAPNAPVGERFLDPVREVDIVVLAAEPTEAQVAYRAGQQALSQRDALTKALQGNTPSVASSDADEAARATFPTDLYTFAWLRRAFRPDDNTVYLGEPNILTRQAGLRRSAAGQPTYWMAFDIVENAVRTRTETTPRTSLLQGVIDSNLEVVLASSELPSTNIAEAMATNPDPSRWRLLSDSLDPILALEIRPDRLLIGSATNDLSEIGWWRVDLRRGTVIAMTPRGWGGTQGMHELGFQNAEAAGRTMGFLIKMGSIVLCHFWVASKSVEGNVAKDIAGTVVCIAVGGMTGFGGILKGALGQMLSAYGGALGFGWAMGAAHEELMK